MSSVKIKSGIKTLEVEWPDKGILQKQKEVYSFGVGNKETLLQWQEKSREFGNLEKKLQDESSFGIMCDQANELVLAIFGEKTYRRILKRSHNDIFALFQIIQAAAELIRDALEDFSKITKTSDEK
ncbi:hypothetical protein FACS1894164_10960 [Spirochaetia bacterium]|nr:hypothetical protein FACS1894164_10960 [Spirochaetia bacterium]